MARPPEGPRLVRRLDGEAQAKERLEVILETVSGQLTVKEACEQLSISEARFHQLRQEALSSALKGLEPKARGRPKRAQASPEAERIAVLEAQVEGLETELLGARLREELQHALPLRQKGGSTQSEEERKAAAAERKRRRRERRLARGAELRAQRASTSPASESKPALLPSEREDSSSED